MVSIRPHVNLEEISQSIPKTHHAVFQHLKTPHGMLLVVVILVLHAVITDTILFFLIQRKNPPVETTQTDTALKAIALNTTNNTCPTACISYVDSMVQNKTADTTTQTTPIYTSTTINNGPREFSVSFGGGQSTASDWTNVPGAAAQIDSTAYGTITQVVFQAGVYIPTGNQTAYVRLFNATDQHPVWFSDVSIDGGAPGLLISNPITLDPGIKTYQVQMKTSLQYAANLTQAQIIISSQ